MEAGWSIRKAGLEDLEDLVRLRMALLHSTRGVERFENDEALVELTRQYLARAMPAGRFHAWVAEAGGRRVASGGVMPFERPPVPGNMAGLEMHILNMYTEPGWRGRGIARALFSELMRFAREQGAGRIWLHATAEGRPLYESVGFQPKPHGAGVDAPAGMNQALLPAFPDLHPGLIRIAVTREPAAPSRLSWSPGTFPKE